MVAAGRWRPPPPRPRALSTSTRKRWRRASCCPAVRNQRRAHHHHHHHLQPCVLLRHHPGGRRSPLNSGHCLITQTKPRAVVVHKAISEKADKKDQQQLHHHGHRKEDVVHRRTEPATKEGEHSSRGAEDRKRSRNRSKERMEKRHKERDHGEDPQQSVRGQASRSDSAQTVPRPTTGHEKKKRKEKLQLSPEKLTASPHPQYEASRQLGQGGPTTISPKKENLPLPSQPPRPPSQLPSHPPQLPSQPPPLPSQPLKLSSQPPPLPSQPLKLPSQPPQLFAALKASLSDDEGELFEEEPVRY